MKDQVDDTQKNQVKSFQSLIKEQELLAKVIEFFPYPIQIFYLDGTARMINKATLNMIGIKSVESHVGKYNCFNDPIIRENGVIDKLKRVLKGETVYITDFNASYQDMIRYFNVADKDIQTISSDITCFLWLTLMVRWNALVPYLLLERYTKGKKKSDGLNNT